MFAYASAKLQMRAIASDAPDATSNASILNFVQVPSSLVCDAAIAPVATSDASPTNFVQVPTSSFVCVVDSIAFDATSDSSTTNFVLAPSSSEPLSPRLILMYVD